MAAAQVNAGAGDAASKIFLGYDTVRNAMLSSSAVDGKYKESDGARNVCNIEVCESVSDLARALEIDSSLSVSYLKSASATAKMKFMNSLKVTEKSLSIVVYANNESGTWSVNGFALKSEDDKPANDQEAAAFVRTYGDSFVKQATLGGEYYAVYTFRTTTSEEQSKLKTALELEGIYAGVTAKADVQVKIKNFTNRSTVHWTLKQEMTGLKGVALPDEDKLIEFALGFSGKTMNSPVTTGFAVEGYERIPKIGKAFDKVAANRRKFVGERGIMASLARLRGVKNQIEWLQAIYTTYKFQDPDLDAFEKKVDADLRTVEALIQDWTDNATGDFTAPALPSLEVGMPVLEFAEGQPASFGQEGGTTFDFMPVAEAFAKQVRIAAIRLSDGDWKKFKVIRRIEVDYESEKGPFTRSHGEGGSGREKFSLRKGQFPSLLNIRHGEFVDAIEVCLDDGRSTSAGGGGGHLSPWKPGPGAVVLGFAGRSGAALDQIKIIHGALKKASYVKSR